jgi:hypothetical protein
VSDLAEHRKPCWRVWPQQPCERLMLLGVGKRQANRRRRAKRLDPNSERLRAALLSAKDDLLTFTTREREPISDPQRNTVSEVAVSAGWRISRAFAFDPWIIVLERAS